MTGGHRLLSLLSETIKTPKTTIMTQTTAIMAQRNIIMTQSTRAVLTEVDFSFQKAVRR